jgi:hypothetical protein
VLSLIVRLLRLASLVICAIVIASFAIFAVDQTKTASKHQTEALSGGAPSTSNGSAAGSTAHEGSVRKAIDDANRELTSPFAGVVSGSSSEWLSRGAKLVLALLVYGFVVGFLARTLRVRI